MKLFFKKILYFLFGEKKISDWRSIFFNRDEGFGESSLIYEYFLSQKITGTLVDVGAHFGESFDRYLKLKWGVLAFEPDSGKWQALEKYKAYKKFTFYPYAVSRESCSDAAFYASEESTGISTLSPFVETHKEISRVEVVTLKMVLMDKAISDVTFLKIDTEGHDLFVLEGFPWERLSPQIILCEFEDFKTKRLGYDYRNLGDFLINKGYEVYLSEWHPVVKYGGNHLWKRLIKYPASLEDENAWGNFIAVSTDSAISFFDQRMSSREKS